MNEIMEATDKLFTEKTYHEITLTTIAEALGWSRGNLYKYVTTKEEIFLELYLKKQTAYLNDTRFALSNKEDLTDEILADIWSKVLDNNHSFLSYYSILATIIETNVTVERLAEFKKRVVTDAVDVIALLEKHGKLTPEKANKLFATMIFHATGLNNSCNLNPIIKEAMKIAEIPEMNIDFANDFKEFMIMCLKGYKYL